MNWVLKLRKVVLRDVNDACAWYDAQRIGLGAEFRAEVDRVLAKLEQQPLSFQDIYHGVRRVGLKRFPYRVYYRVRGREVRVFAVVHGARPPEIWQKRI